MVAEHRSIPRRGIPANQRIRPSERLLEQAVATQPRRLHRERRRARPLSLNDPFAAEEGPLGIATHARRSQVQRPLEGLTWRWDGSQASRRNKLAIFAVSEQPDGP